MSGLVGIKGSRHCRKSTRHHRLDKCHVRKMGLSFYVDLHIVVNGQLSAWEGHRLAHKVEAEVLKALPQVSEVLVHVDGGGASCRGAEGRQALTA